MKGHVSYNMRPVIEFCFGILYMEAVYDVVHFPIIVSDTEDESTSHPTNIRIQKYGKCFFLSISILISSSLYPYDFMGHNEVIS